MRTPKPRVEDVEKARMIFDLVRSECAPIVSIRYTRKALATARAEGRADGIREAAAFLNTFGTTMNAYGIAQGIAYLAAAGDILELLDTPQGDNNG